LGEEFVVELAHQLSEPEIASCLDSITDKGCEQIIAIPLLPQHNPLTSGRIIAELEKRVLSLSRSPELKVIPDYHAHPAYIDAIAESIMTHWRTQQRQRFLMLVFNGCTSEDSEQQEQYQQQCVGTAHLVATILGISSDQWAIAYHSHLGKPSLLEPLASALIHSKAEHNLKEIDVSCPGFATENMVSQQIIHKHLSKQFMAQGGEQFYYIPCLNASENQLQILEELVRNELKDS
jgi:ferrochelatase